jgi:hypothetical protein
MATLALVPLAAFQLGKFDLNPSEIRNYTYEPENKILYTPGGLDCHSFSLPVNVAVRPLVTHVIHT